MSKPNRSGLTPEQSRQLKAQRFQKNADERRESRRAINPDFNELMDRVASGELTHAEGVAKLQQMQNDGII